MTPESAPQRIEPPWVDELLGLRTIELDRGWQWFKTKPSLYSYPSEIAAQIELIPVTVPGALAHSVTSSENLAELDQYDHWYKLSFEVPNQDNKDVCLTFDGLITLAEVYLNGVLLFRSDNAYHTHKVNISHLVQPENLLFICFRALAPQLASKHPRGRFATRLINERHLRFYRTPLLGYTPGFFPPIKPVGPHRPVKMQYLPPVNLLSTRICANLNQNGSGTIDLRVLIQCEPNTQYENSYLVLSETNSGEIVSQIKVELKSIDSERLSVDGSYVFENVQPYWPHTHGDPKRYQLDIHTSNVSQSTTVNLGKIGFRRFELTEEEFVAVQVNGLPIYLRGGCWTPLDALRLYTPREQLRERLMLLRDAGVNMVRIPGNMLYETDEFYELCDELGILVFQDFAFANFDYPDTNEDFLLSVKKEAAGFLSRHGHRPALAVLSGNSEVLQQAAMMGVPLTGLHNAIFDEILPAIVADYAPGSLYFNSSPSGGEIPFHPGRGPSHYYGVGGYMRPLEDARVYRGRFISECLAFSHVPEDESLRKMYNGEVVPVHHPRWKAAVPRDVGAGWDFADITDFYVTTLFDVDPVRLRAVDLERYLCYCRAATVEVVERTLSVFRANSSQGRVALVWYLNDLQQGAGWGYIDALGQPKSSFYGLKRTSQPTTVLFVNEGLEGLAVYLSHEGSDTVSAELDIALINEEGRVFEQNISLYSLPPRKTSRVSVDAWLGRFVDSSYAYRFGPRGFVACVASLKTPEGETLTQNIYADPSVTHQLTQDIGLTAELRMGEDGTLQLEINSIRPAFFVVIDIPDYLPEDNYFHVMPGFDKKVLIYPQTKSRPPHGRVRALNSKMSTPIKIEI